MPLPLNKRNKIKQDKRIRMRKTLGRVETVPKTQLSEKLRNILDNAKRHAEFLSDSLKNTLIEKKPSVLRNKKSREFISNKERCSVIT